MKLEKVLDCLNSFEKNSFLKIIDSIIQSKPKNASEIDKILSDKSKDLKNIDNINIAKVFYFLEDEFSEHLNEEFITTTSQLDLLIDIIIRDGNCIMKQDWFSHLYDIEVKSIQSKKNAFEKSYFSEKIQSDDPRSRDYKIYKECIEAAYKNDLLYNREPKITSDEQSILSTLSRGLELSQESVKLIHYLIVGLKKEDIDTLINNLRNIGIVFYSKKNSIIYIADEIVRILRKLRGKEIADKFFRRVLRTLREPQINLICKKHNIDWRLDINTKIKKIISSGITFSGLLMNDIFKEGTKISDKKSFINDFCDKKLKIFPLLKGVTLEDKINNLIKYFDEVEREERVGISVDGYDNLLIDLVENLPSINDLVKDEFELQDEFVLKSKYLLNYNIKPRDILDIVPEEKLLNFCQSLKIKTRGDIILNILDVYKDADNLYLENYENIGYRNLNALKENGIRIKEAELGLKFEEITKTILTKLGFNIDEKLRRSINTNKDKMDIIINLENNELILVECKSIKEGSYSKFSSVSRQLKAYINLAKSNGFKVVKSLLIAPEFSDDFIKDCGLDYELNLSLLSAAALYNIYNGFKDSKFDKLPYNLLMRDVLIQEERILKAIQK